MIESKMGPKAALKAAQPACGTGGVGAEPDGSRANRQSGKSGERPVGTHGCRDAVRPLYAASPLRTATGMTSGGLKPRSKGRLTPEEKHIHTGCLLSEEGDAAGGALPSADRAAAPRFRAGDATRMSTSPATRAKTLAMRTTAR
ncbi:hypothetical protein [Streptomyces iconiensis]|uniref:Uncharacterized protein n=1 Tax=Streptomyces iconiensis TaxID=1384038 RepID=A0ABT6ZNP0_9ACTN|nr:hypothetical protein [Streptomyces iconiensis]MDJ1130672.1 hypothetical protein [Streptomyces iconiensis]